MLSYDITLTSRQYLGSTLFVKTGHVMFSKRRVNRLISYFVSVLIYRFTFYTTVSTAVGKKKGSASMGVQRKIYRNHEQTSNPCASR